MTSLKILCFFLLVRNVCADLRTDPLVHTNVGLIKGVKATDGDYSMFLGIPYASVDKENPFGASIPHPKFEDIFEANDDSALCPQVDDITNNITGTLDCLHLNVFSPNTATSNNLLPIIFSIHGGFFQKGSFDRRVYGPRFLVRHDVILVTINYRLGPYGFMCLDTPEIPGNQGLKDQLLALNWVKDNIEAFGGDPNQITITGQSAGGAAVDFHLMYPGERLFNKVLMQSGVALTPARIIESDASKPIQLAEYFGFVTSDLNGVLKFLATIDTGLIIAATLNLGIAFRACVEKKFENVDIFIAEHPANAGRPHVKNIPVLIGSVDKELMATYININSEYFSNLNVFKEELENVFDFGEDINAVQETVRNFYVGDHTMTEDDKWNVINFASDWTYVHPIQRAMRKYLENGAENIYYYLFTYDGARNMAKFNNNITAPGAIHADELGYLFDVSSLVDVGTPEDQLVVDRMTTMWTNFAKYGNPTPTITELLSTPWTPITAQKWHCLNINRDLTLEGRPFHDRLAFWDLFFRAYGKLEKGVQVNEERIMAQRCYPKERRDVRVLTNGSYSYSYSYLLVIYHYMSKI